MHAEALRVRSSRKTGGCQRRGGDRASTETPRKGQASPTPRGKDDRHRSAEQHRPPLPEIGPAYQGATRRGSLLQSGPRSLVLRCGGALCCSRSAALRTRYVWHDGDAVISCFPVGRAPAQQGVAPCTGPRSRPIEAFVDEGACNITISRLAKGQKLGSGLDIDASPRLVVVSCAPGRTRCISACRALRQCPSRHTPQAGQVSTRMRLPCGRCFCPACLSLPRASHMPLHMCARGVRLQPQDRRRRGRTPTCGLVSRSVSTSGGGERARHSSSLWKPKHAPGARRVTRDTSTTSYRSSDGRCRGLSPKPSITVGRRRSILLVPALSSAWAAQLGSCQSLRRRRQPKPDGGVDRCSAKCGSPGEIRSDPWGWCRAPGAGCRYT